MVSVFPEILMDHFRSPRNVGPLANPDVEGLAGVAFQGTFMKLQAELDGRIMRGNVPVSRVRADDSRRLDGNDAPDG